LAKKQPPIKDNTLWYDQLNFFPPEDKNALWLSQALFYSKLNGIQLLDTKRKKTYRDLEKGIINKQDYINLLDPITPMGGGGKAEYIASDFKDCPIDVHLDNIMRTKLDKIGFENKLQVSEIDKFAKSQKQKDKDKIIYQREFRKLINSVHEMLHLPPIKESETPYAYVKSLSEKDSDNMIGNVDTLLDYIKSEIHDNQDLTLYETYLYKGDIERAFELGIEHYLINLNKWRIKGSRFNNDLKHFLKACGRWYIDETNGRGTVEYLEPDYLYTSPFIQENGEDITYWHYEYYTTFAEFVRQFGQGLTDAQLKEVFELNRNQGGNHRMNYDKAGSIKGSNASIKIGVFSILTQDAEKFSEEYANGKVPVWKRKPLSWLPKEGKNKEEGEIRQKIYNTWYSCYYIPPPGDKTSRNTQADWAWQSQYVFNIHKDVDMYRYGVDMRYAKSTLVIWKDESRLTYTDIKEAFMPKIRTTWHKFQNCLVQDTTALAMSNDFLGGLLKAVDEQNKINPNDPDNPTGGNGLDAAMQSMRMLKHGGMAFLNFRDKNGNLVLDPSKLFVPIDTGHLGKAERYLKIILEQYNLMTLALAQNDGVEQKPRVAVAGVEEAMNATKEGMWFVEKPCREFLIMYGERCVQHILNMVKERKKYGYQQRWEEFSSVIGMANVLMLEGIEDLNAEEIGITVNLEDVRGKQQEFTLLCREMLRDGKIEFADVQMIESAIQQNYKYGAALLNISAKKMEREMAHKQELLHQQQMELKDQDLKIAMALNNAKTQGKNSNIETKGKIDAQLADLINKGKAQTMAAQKQQLLNNKLTQDNNKSRLNKEEKTSDALAPTQP